MRSNSILKKIKLPNGEQIEDVLTQYIMSDPFTILEEVAYNQYDFNDFEVIRIDFGRFEVSRDNFQAIECAANIYLKLDPGRYSKKVSLDVNISFDTNLGQVDIY
jgi:hypothetical protein